MEKLLKKLEQLKYEISLLGLDEEEVTGVSIRTDELKELIKQGQTLPLDSVSQRSKLLDFKEWWNNLDDESDDKLYMTEETIDRYLKSNCG